MKSRGFKKPKKNSAFRLWTMKDPDEELKVDYKEYIELKNSEREKQGFCIKYINGIRE